ncbi:TetR/AcrR family transcriptional regulator [Streptomyces griseus]|uniref:TetR-family transcriptional regulator n=1 Tax=Streptomyces griseus subsp. griseus (strain JCM 4626 / CBS 651.72 / NBRC 13350 / KCC S-0626 / ISP 5235) TaxID=455632 RepID=B1W124_STRGG|nr:TetR family transcriptional regulator [Streptomyces griseus]MBW3708109.1 TetR family transcriptional regulator [Streptomyces griseus]NEB51787.1 TetR family transcriptional regulator [Streptomyces griseus]SEE52895.1 DNA-binding transcriptional regulator YbjK [Streptomyces griseus]SQA22221.1 TetR family transcriptional regulator [Streptomyces griseus]BAG22434.1 putative TetR-family transcriptional regulator [Streptomyces griseus subsp. griseus NBRC 13350]
MARRYDPGRRERIVDAALRVIAADGIAGLSHRTVAAEADVPLGSTTYHFGSLDELLVAALRRYNDNFVRELRGSQALAGPGGVSGPTGPAGPDGPAGPAGLAEELTRLLGRWFAGERGAIELEYELYLAALRRPVLRPVAAEWTEEAVELLSRRTDRETARALVALMDGVCLQVLLTGGAFDAPRTREMLGRIVDGGG